MSITINGTTGISGVDGTAGSPALQGNDTNTGVVFGTDTVGVSTGGVQRATVDSSGRLLVGTSTTVNGSVLGSTETRRVQFYNTVDSGDQGVGVYNVSNTPYAARLEIGTAKTGFAALASNNYLGILSFVGSDGSKFVSGAMISAEVDGSASTNDLPTRLVFSTTADGASSPTERMRITSASNTTIKIVGINSTDTGGFNFVNSSQVVYWNIATNNNTFYIADSDFTNFAYLPQNPTSWLFASDERLKENIAELEYGIDAVKQLQPRRFNFVGNDKSTIGFIAQELKNVVPEAVSGEEVPYEETDTPQQKASKSLGVGKETLVPVLVKALQEAIAKIETLEAKVAALESA